LKDGECSFYVKKNLKSSINSRTHCIKNNWSSFDNTIAMSNEDGEGEEINDFTRLVENYEKTWKLVNEELKVINLDTEQEKKELKIGTFITTEKKDDIISLFHEYVNVFAWTYADMLNLDIDIVVHRIPLVAGSKLVKQKTIKIRSDILLKVKTKIQK